MAESEQHPPPPPQRKTNEQKLTQIKSHMKGVGAEAWDMNNPKRVLGTFLCSKSHSFLG